MHTIIYKFIPLAIGAIGMYPAVRQHLKASEENFRSAGLPVETFILNKKSQIPNAISKFKQW